MRNLLQVIDRMTLEIPDDQEALLLGLAEFSRINRYKAPESQTWHECSKFLQTMLEPHRSDINPAEPWDNDWCEPVLKIWRDEK